MLCAQKTNNEQQPKSIQATLYVVLPIFKQVLAYARAHALAWPFASDNVHVLLNDFVRVFNTTGDAMVDIHHSLEAFVALVRSNYVRA